jgi:hypothetical protein
MEGVQSVEGFEEQLTCKAMVFTGVDIIEVSE